MKQVPRCVAALAAAALPAAADASPQGPPRAERSDCQYFYDGPDHQIAFDPFVIFFDLDSSAITARAARILDGVAAAYRSRPHCAIRIWAHADRSGPADYNRALARRRARAVAAYLRRKGIRMPFRFESHGEDRPLVETPDGVPEPQNRRAEILIGPREGAR